MKDITISTGAISRPHQVIDAVIAVDHIETALFSTDKANEAFEDVKGKLRNLCLQLKGDAVINCRFQYHLSSPESYHEPDQRFQIFAYGTVVKLLE